MAGVKPRILVVVADGGERAAIAALLCEAGFAVVAAPDRGSAGALLQRQPFVAAVVDAVGEWRTDVKALILGEAATLPPEGRDGDRLLIRPFEPRRLLDAILELVLREEPRHRDAAEHGIAAARRACHRHRPAAARAALG
jgi:hypothetical protein